MSRQLNADELSRWGLERVDALVWVRCTRCGDWWSTLRQRDGTLSTNWWRCPQGCNTQGRPNKRDGGSLSLADRPVEWGDQKGGVVSTQQTPETPR